jgi:cobalt-zinc-cadmium efflux system outer membrane protein
VDQDTGFRRFVAGSIWLALYSLPAVVRANPLVVPNTLRQSFALATIFFLLGLARATSAASEQVQAAVEEPLGQITLSQALELALTRNPELAAAGNEIAATDAAVLQSGALPNPVLGISGQYLGNSRVRDDGDRTANLELGQLIELGGKRAARVRFAETGRDLAGWDYRAKLADVTLQVSLAFVDLLASQQRQALAKQSLELATAFSDAVSRRVQAGKASPVDATRARRTTSEVQIELEQATRELAAARRRLAALWNAPGARFEVAVGDLEAISPLPGYEQLQQRTPANPDVARWGSEIAQRDAGVRVEKAKAVPDVTLIGGVSRFSQFNDTAYTIGINIPLPLFDRNRGGILEATRRLGKTLDSKQASLTRVSAELGQAYERGAAVYSEIQTLRSSILPDAKSAYDAAAKGYELGKFGFLDVLDAERSLFQSRAQYLRALAEYQRGMKEIERLIGSALDPGVGAPQR